MFPVIQALPLIIAGGQALIGAGQRVAANRRRKKALANMNYDIPSATQEQVNLLRQRASRNELPGADTTRSRIESDLAGTMTAAERAATTSQDVLGAYAKMFGQKSNINKQLLEAGANYKSANELELTKGLGLLAEAEGQQFYYNKFVPFLSEMGFAGDQAAGGAANIASGLQTAYNTWENEWMMEQYGKLYGQGDDAVYKPSGNFNLVQNGINRWDTTKPMTNWGTTRPELWNNRWANTQPKMNTPAPQPRLRPWE
jgi:hypothetical protein